MGPTLADWNRLAETASGLQTTTFGCKFCQLGAFRWPFRDRRARRRGDPFMAQK